MGDVVVVVGSGVCYFVMVSYGMFLVESLIFGLGYCKVLGRVMVGGCGFL